MSERRDSRDRTANARRGGNSGWSRWKLSVGELPEKPGIAVHATRRGRHARWHACGTPALLNAHIRKLLVRMGSSVGRPSRLTTNAGERSPGPHQPHEKMGMRDARPTEHIRKLLVRRLGRLCIADAPRFAPARPFRQCDDPSSPPPASRRWGGRPQPETARFAFPPRPRVRGSVRSVRSVRIHSLPPPAGAGAPPERGVRGWGSASSDDSYSN